MKLLRTILLSALMAVGGRAVADDFKYLTVSETGGETSYEVSNVQKITFDADYMVLHMSNGTTQKMALSGLSKMFFASSPTGLGTIATEQKISFSGGMLRATLNAGESISVYNMKGEKVFSAVTSGSYDLSMLTKGVYIIQVGNEAKKVVNK